MSGIIKRNRLVCLIALAICIVMMTAGCSATEEAAMAGNSETSDIEEKVKVMNLYKFYMITMEIN